MTLPATGAGTSKVNEGEKPRTWAEGPRISDLERRHYEFEGGGAASERQIGKRRRWWARWFRRAHPR